VAKNSPEIVACQSHTVRGSTQAGPGLFANMEFK
jgi:hypothetical protein